MDGMDLDYKFGLWSNGLIPSSWNHNLKYLQCPFTIGVFLCLKIVQLF